MVTTIEIAWLVGLMEGEGYFAHTSHSLAMRLAMNDEDVVRRAARLLRGPDYSPSARLLPSGKLSWYVDVNGKTAAQWMMTLYPLMGERRQAKIRASLALWRIQPGVGQYNRLRTHCKRGHEFTPENTRPYISRIGTLCRQCRECDRIRSQRSRIRLGLVTNPRFVPLDD